MAAQQQRIDAVSNDVANVSTAGYKKQRLDFRDLAYAEERSGNGVRAGAGAGVAFAGRSEAPGTIEQTGEPLDLAIEGDGYIQVRRADGSLGLTRQGALRLNVNGQLITAAGDRVEPAITIPRDTDPSSISVRSDGAVTAAGREVGQIRLRDVPAPSGLLSVGNSVFVATEASGDVRNATGTVRQGALERSNVDMGDAMVDLMDAQRSYTLASRALQTQDQIMEIANGVKR
jgi:flagellar basal-body rod protein FlgG